MAVGREVSGSESVRIMSSAYRPILCSMSATIMPVTCVWVLTASANGSIMSAKMRGG